MVYMAALAHISVQLSHECQCTPNDYVKSDPISEVAVTFSATAYRRDKKSFPEARIPPQSGHGFREGVVAHYLEMVKQNKVGYLGEAAAGLFEFDGFGGETIELGGAVIAFAQVACLFEHVGC